MNKENDFFSINTAYLFRNFDSHSHGRMYVDVSAEYFVKELYEVHEKCLGERAVTGIAIVRTRYTFCPSTFMVLLGP